LQREATGFLFPVILSLEVYVMKKISAFPVKAFLVLFLCAALFSACNRGERPAPNALDRDTSYAFGMLMASQMGLSDLSFDYNAFMEGFRDFNEARETRLTQERAMERVIAALTRLEAENNEEMLLEAQRNLEEGEAYLAENARRSGVITTDSGLQYEVVSQGSGARPGLQDIVRVHYEGTFINGTVFDSSYQRGEPTEFPVGRVIPGWVEGIQLMSVGSTYRFVIPSNLAYGSPGAGPIPPNSTLIFRVELLDIVR
jgi:FKBP-type peptidyl-prolyl cis-trans isomerase